MLSAQKPNRYPLPAEVGDIYCIVIFYYCIIVLVDNNFPEWTFPCIEAAFWFIIVFDTLYCHTCTYESCSIYFLMESSTNKLLFQGVKAYEYIWSTNASELRCRLADSDLQILYIKKDSRKKCCISLYCYIRVPVWNYSQDTVQQGYYHGFIHN